MADHEPARVLSHVVCSPTCLRVCYAMSGTATADGISPICLRACYAMSGTAIAERALWYLPACVRAMHHAGLRYGVSTYARAMHCPALTHGMVLPGPPTALPSRPRKPTPKRRSHALSSYAAATRCPART
eukprot:2972222-Rhodomonas_salina.2